MEASCEDTIWQDDFIRGIGKNGGEGKGIASMSPQAVGGAVGHNRISILIPCHRVIGANGSLTGYAGGVDKKERLLLLENADMENYLCLPKERRYKGWNVYWMSV